MENGSIDLSRKAIPYQAIPYQAIQNFPFFVSDYFNDFLTKFLHNVNNPVLKGLCKFQVDISINARVTSVQRLENLYTFILPQP